MPTVFADHYVHDLSPFVPFLKFGDSFGVRWYGLAYVAGFVAAWWLMRRLVRKGCGELREEKVADFITLAAVLGVMLGGRLGYMLFYNFENFIEKPWIFFRLLDGGMSSHGGILGLVIFTWFYARHQKISWPGLGDNLVVVSTVGIFFGRLANFINGELYGRRTDVAWGVKFPSELADSTSFSAAKIAEVAKACAEAEPGLQPAVSSIISEGSPQARYQLTDLLSAAARESAGVRDVLAQFLHTRHPSQLYEAVLEGLILFGILLAVRLRWKNAWHGFITGLFFVLYAVARIAVEQLREPDSTLVGLLGLELTKGQFYSVFMILVGAAFIGYAVKTKRRNQLPDAA